MTPFSTKMILKCQELSKPYDNSNIVNKADPHFSVSKNSTFIVTNDFTVNVLRLIYSF